MDSKIGAPAASASVRHALYTYLVDLRPSEPPGRDAALLFLSRGVRMFSFGFLAVILVLYLQELGISTKNVGVLFSCTLAGDAVLSLLLTSVADRFGRRRSLILGSIVSLTTSIIFSFADNFLLLLLCGIFGIITPSGGEIGPFMSIELSGISAATKASDRTKIMAWYNLLGSLCSAAGAVACGQLVTRLHESTGLLGCYRSALALYSSLHLLKLVIFTQLGASIEAAPKAAPIAAERAVSSILGLHKSKAVVARLSGLFLIDSFAGALILQSFVSSWFSAVYGTDAAMLGAIVFVCNVLAGFSSLLAVKFAEMMGLVMTMVVTHLPSNVMIMLVPLMPNESAAVVLLCVRYSISQMDVPCRNAYIQGIVADDERSAANGVTNMARSVGGAAGPALASMFYASASTSSYPFLLAGLLKIVYDLLLLRGFKDLRTPEEQREREQAEEGLEMAPAAALSASPPRPMRDPTKARAVRSAAVDYMPLEAEESEEDMEL